MLSTRNSFQTKDKHRLKRTEKDIQYKWYAKESKGGYTV